MNRRKFIFKVAADALLGDSWYLMDLLEDYNDPNDPVTVGEVVEELIREANRE